MAKLIFRSNYFKNESSRHKANYVKYLGTREGAAFDPEQLPKAFYEDADTLCTIRCSWPKKSSGGYQLHGHIHARMEYNEKNRAEDIRRYDVGVDANNFFPVSVKQVIDFFGEQVNVNDHDIV